ncbi:hypothetical protein KY285_015937 [Solanum tuberosum]|nr:hypothetical protein KY285_015937 [Solanum tuberosum]
MGPSQKNLPAVDRKVMKQGPGLAHHQQLKLCEEVNDQEIWDGLKGITDDKAPGIDGYTACVFKKTWQAVKEDVYSAVKDFFKTGTICKIINCTTITLVPKIPNPVTVKGFRPIAYHQQLKLCEEVNDQEIWDGLKGITDDKAPGIDGYTACVFKKTWQAVKEDVYSAVKDFFKTGTICKIINCTTITLVPKIPNPVTVKGFRPIACYTVLYKIIAKVMATSMQKIMPSIICEAQAGFIPGRRICDNIILAQELVQAYIRKHISARCMIKIDLQKAYDSVEWIYLEQVLEELCFPAQFRRWIMQCVTTVNYTVLVNGAPTDSFDVAKGLRQGDPISPYLFAIVM